MAEQFTWRVELPKKRQSGLGSSKPQATLYTHNDEVFCSIPKDVAKALLKAEHEGWNASNEVEFQKKLALLERKSAWERLIGLLNRRDLTTYEARERLKHDGYSESALEAALAQAQTLRFIDDDRYAETYVRSKALQGWGKRRIEHELKRRGISEPNAAMLEDVLGGSEGELERAREVLVRKSVPTHHPYESLVRFLVRRGFDLSVAKDAASEKLHPDT